MGEISDYAKICKDTHITDENLTDYFIVDTITEFDARVYSKGNEIVICFQASK